MDQSGPFLQKHPDQMLLWRLRAAGAISLNSPTAGYEAGQKLLAMGAEDGNDLNLRRLLAQLKNRGYLDRQEVQKQGKYDWVLGTWSVSCSYLDLRKRVAAAPIHFSYSNVEFSKSASVIEGYSFSSEDAKFEDPVYRGTILDSGEIGWEWTANLPHKSAAWMPAISFEPGEDRRTMTIVFTSPSKDSGPQTLLFTRID